jgi:hypothetical protein
VRDVVLDSMIITQPRVDFPLLESPANGAATARKYRSFDFSVSVEEEDQVLKFLDSKLVRKRGSSLPLYIIICNEITIAAQL